MVLIRRPRSPIQTAIEWTPEEAIIKEKITKDIEKSLCRLAHQTSSDTTSEIIVEDQWSHLRRLEEIQIIKSIDDLSCKYPELWQKVINNNLASSSEFPDNFTKNAITSECLRQNRLPINLQNWRERVIEEFNENDKFLKKLYARKKKLELEREQVNRMVNTITHIFDNSYTNNEVKTTIHNSNTSHLSTYSNLSTQTAKDFNESN